MMIMEKIISERIVNQKVNSLVKKENGFDDGDGFGDYGNDDGGDYDQFGDEEPKKEDEEDSNKGKQESDENVGEESERQNSQNGEEGNSDEDNKNEKGVGNSEENGKEELKEQIINPNDFESVEEYIEALDQTQKEAYEENKVKSDKLKEEIEVFTF